MNNSPSDLNSAHKECKRIEGVATIATTSINLPQEWSTQELLRSIKNELGGFDEKTHYGGRIFVDLNFHQVSVDLTVNSITNRSPLSSSGEMQTDKSDRVRINAKTNAELNSLSSGLTTAYAAVRQVLNSINQIPYTSGKYSFLIELRKEGKHSISLTDDGLTDRDMTRSGYQSECFENKIKVKQVPINEANTAITDLEELVAERISDLD